MSNMKHYEVRNIGQNRGVPRIWLQGKLPSKGGFLPGVKYSAKAVAQKSMLVLEVEEGGARVVSHKEKNGREFPVIDINSAELLSVFQGVETVRVVVQAGRIYIMPLASELRAKARLAALRTTIASGQPVTTGSVSSGIGVLDHAAHKGLAKAGIDTRLIFTNEIREDCQNHAMEHNPLYTDETVTVTAPMQELAFDAWGMSQVPECQVMVAGVPCSGASVAGRTKGKLEHAESHPEVGHLVVSFLAILAKMNPVAVVLENVPQYLNTASMCIIRSSLRDLGYTVHETELDAAEWGMLEHRRRMCMVAVTKGIEFDFTMVARPLTAVKTFGDIMEDVPLDHSTWGSIDYLWKKRERDAAEGKGFAPTVINKDSTKIPTLNKTLHKRQSTGTFIQHPENPELYRIPTIAEHAAAKGVDKHLIAPQEVTQTFGHEALGQAISVPPFVSVFEALGKALKASLATLDIQSVSFAKRDLAAA